MNAEIRYYLSVFLRRLPIFLLVALSIATSAVAVALLLPTTYTADASLLVEGPQIPDNMASSTVSVDPGQQLEIVERRLMTRANLIDIARDYSVYEDIASLTPDQIVTRMRDDTRILSRTGRQRATILSVRFSGRTPAIAAQVTNEYVSRILDDNLRIRLRRAGDTLSFFEQEVERLETELGLQSARILKFQNENADSLPDSLSFRMSRAAQLQERLSQMARDRAALEDQRARLIEAYENSDLLAALPGRSQDPDLRRLEGLRNELTAALAIYSEQSPQVRMLRAQLNALEAQVANGAASVDDRPRSEDGRNPQATLLDLQLAEIDAQIAFLDEEFVAAETELSALDETIRRTPNNSIALEALERDYENVQTQYNRAVERLSQAVTGERIETLSRGERITVIEQAVPPTEPSAPNRRMIAGMGSALGFGAAAFLVILLEMLNRAVRRPVDLVNGLGITPLATVPYIATTQEKLRRRLMLLLAFAAVLAGIPAALYVFHYQVMPLDLLVDKIANRLQF